MESYEFGDGGAFPEIRSLQYPLGMGLPSSSSIPMKPGAPQPSPQTSFALTAVPQPLTSQELEEREATTRQKLAMVVAEKTGATSTRPKESVVEYQPQLGTTRVLKVVEKDVDPIAISRIRVKKDQRAPVGDPEPIVRSPTKKSEAIPTLPGFGGSAADASTLPAAVSNWKNTRSLVISLEQRKLAEGKTVAQPISERHFELDDALRSRTAEIKANLAQQDRDRIRENEEAQNRLDADLAMVARDALDAIRQGERKETPEERKARIEAEQEDREKRREEARRVRKQQEMQRRAGYLPEAVGEPDQVDDDVVEVREVPAVDPKRQGAGSFYIPRGEDLQAEAERQRGMTRQPTGDVFAVNELLRKRGRTETE
jgi:SNW domain-containing protein 1